MKYRTLAFLSILLLIVISSVLTPPRGYSFLTPNLAVAGIIYWIIKKEFSLNDDAPLENLKDNDDLYKDLEDLFI